MVKLATSDAMSGGISVPCFQAQAQAQSLAYCTVGERAEYPACGSAEPWVILTMRRKRFVRCNLWCNPRRTATPVLVVSIGLWSILISAVSLDAWSQSDRDTTLRLMIGEAELHAKEHLDDPTAVHRMPMPSGTLAQILDSDLTAARRRRTATPSKKRNRGFCSLQRNRLGRGCGCDAVATYSLSDNLNLVIDAQLPVDPARTKFSRLPVLQPTAPYLEQPDRLYIALRRYL